jgi:hypothetical protein
MGIKQVLSAPQSPWQRAYVERVIGTIRRECLDQMMVFGEGSLYRHLQNFINYSHRSRTHLALAKDSPEPPAGPTARRWTDHRDSGGGWAPSSLRAARRLTPASFLRRVRHVCSTCPRLALSVANQLRSPKAPAPGLASALGCQAATPTLSRTLRILSSQCR